MSTVILGIDPGLNTSGYGVVEITARGPSLVEAGVIRGGRSKSIESRLHEIHQGVVEVLEAFRPAALALEQLYSHYDRPRTAILMGHARGVICLAAARVQVPVMHYAATQVKRLLTGNGRAPKSQMQLAICRELRLDRPPEPADVADALAIALCHHFLARKVA
jgi:crossover junction endodeoxyribonuclease RuvC